MNYPIYREIIDEVEMFNIYVFLFEYNKSQTLKRNTSKWLFSKPSYSVISEEERKQYCLDKEYHSSVRMNIPGKFVYESRNRIFVNYQVFLEILKWCDEKLSSDFSSFYEKKIKQKDEKNTKDTSIGINELKQAYTDLYSVYNTVLNNYNKLAEDYEQSKKKLLKN